MQIHWAYYKKSTNPATMLKIQTSYDLLFGPSGQEKRR
jgi:hypothetical protein